MPLSSFLVFHSLKNIFPLILPCIYFILRFQILVSNLFISVKNIFKNAFMTIFCSSIIYYGEHIKAAKYTTRTYGFDKKVSVEIVFLSHYLSISLSLSLSLSHTHTHTHTLTLSQFLSLSFSFCFFLSHSLT